MEPPLGVEVDRTPSTHDEILVKHLIRAIQTANQAVLSFPLYITLTDAHGRTKMQMRADDEHLTFQLLSGYQKHNPLEYPVDVFVSRRLYPDQVEDKEVFVHCVIELSKAENGPGDWFHSTSRTLAPSAYRNRKEFLKHAAILGWTSRADAAQADVHNARASEIGGSSHEAKNVVAHYEADIRRAIRSGADIFVHTGPGGEAFGYETGPCKDKQTLKIGPLRDEELHQVMAFIRSVAPPTHKAILNSHEFEAYARHRDTGRNSPCPWGSGQKYKKCCGMVQ